MQLLYLADTVVKYDSEKKVVDNLGPPDITFSDPNKLEIDGYSPTLVYKTKGEIKIVGYKEGNYLVYFIYNKKGSVLGFSIAEKTKKPKYE